MASPTLALLNSGSVRTLLQWQWWVSAAKSALRFAPKCVLSATLLTVANILVILTMNYFEKNMQIPQGEVSLAQLQELTVNLVSAMLVTLIALALSLWSLMLWLMRLTAYAKLISDPRASVSPNEIEAVIKEVGARKLPLSMTWSFASLIMLAPALCLVALITLEVLASPSMAHAMPPGLLPDFSYVHNYHFAIIAAEAILGLITLAYSLLVIAYSAVGQYSPVQTGLMAAKQLGLHILPVIGMATFVGLLNVVISAPYLLAGAGELVGNNPVLSCISQIWLGVTSVVLWPLTVTPFCRVVQTED